MSNPLLGEFNQEFNSIPFQSIQNQHFLPAFEQAIALAKQEVDSIINNPEEATFLNTIEALETSGQLLGRISNIFFNLNSAQTNAEMQALAQEISPLLSKFNNDVQLNEALFARIKLVYKSKLNSKLTPEQERLLQETYNSFVRNGANLSKQKKEELREIDRQLSTIALKFMQNTLAETNAYVLHLTKLEEVEGLPESALQAAKTEAENRALEGWVFTLQHPSYVAFVTYAKRRDLREEIYKAYGSKCFKNNELDNQKNIQQLVELRQKRAQILGYDSHADFVLEKRMAKSTNQVHEFLTNLLDQAKGFAQKEIQQLQSIAQRKDNLKNLMPWDHAYYAEILKQEEYNLSQEELRPYFPLNQVLQGAFDLATQLFGIHFRLNKNIEVYHQSVQVYEVVDSQNQHLALLYTDFHPRESKRAGAWQTSYRKQSNIHNHNQRPHVSIVCNFSKPTASKPSLLRFTEVTTLFHEFGHALHSILANTKYESLSGTSVYWDFVELPSQFMENFCYEPEVLAKFAKHYQTGQIIPLDLVQKIQKSANFLEAYQTLRQISFGLLDLAYHSNQYKENQSIVDFEQSVFAPTQLYPIVPEVCMSCSFNHIFSGGYAAGYYSYKWAELLDADAFEYFKENGLFNPAIAKKFKKLLASGGTKDPMELYLDFRGKKPEIHALLIRAGLLTPKENEYAKANMN